MRRHSVGREDDLSLSKETLHHLVSIVVRLGHLTHRRRHSILTSCRLGLQRLTNLTPAGIITVGPIDLAVVCDLPSARALTAGHTETYKFYTNKLAVFHAVVAES